MATKYAGNPRNNQGGMLRSDYLYKIPIIDDDIIVMGERE